MSLMGFCKVGLQGILFFFVNFSNFQCSEFCFSFFLEDVRSQCPVSQRGSLTLYKHTHLSPNNLMSTVCEEAQPLSLKKSCCVFLPC